MLTAIETATLARTARLNARRARTMARNAEWNSVDVWNAHAREWSGVARMWEYRVRAMADAIIMERAQ